MNRFQIPLQRARFRGFLEFLDRRVKKVGFNFLHEAFQLGFSALEFSGRFRDFPFDHFVEISGQFLDDGACLQKFLPLVKAFEFALNKQSLQPGLNTIIITPLDNAAFNVQGLTTRL